DTRGTDTAPAGHSVECRGRGASSSTVGARNSASTGVGSRSASGKTATLPVARRVGSSIRADTKSAASASTTAGAPVPTYPSAPPSPPAPAVAEIISHRRAADGAIPAEGDSGQGQRTGINEDAAAQTAPSSAAVAPTAAARVAIPEGQVADAPLGVHRGTQSR